MVIDVIGVEGSGAEQANSGEHGAIWKAAKEPSFVGNVENGMYREFISARLDDSFSSLIGFEQGEELQLVVDEEFTSAKLDDSFSSLIGFEQGEELQLVVDEFDLVRFFFASLAYDVIVNETIFENGNNAKNLLSSVRHKVRFSQSAFLREDIYDNRESSIISWHEMRFCKWRIRGELITVQ
uniref:Uncharacterized protein n=1 Tax=Ascaris lumbricoides TaxID=6252 RepID=A0A0M3INF7_ASCLU